MKPQVSGRKELIKIRGEINEIDTKKMIGKKTIKLRTSLKIIKIDKPLAGFTKKKERTQIIKIKMKEEILQLIPEKYKGS